MLSRPDDLTLAADKLQNSKINPAHARFLPESMVIGRLLLSYGELELSVGVLLGNTLPRREPAFRMMFRIIGETARIDAADAMMRDKYKSAGLETEYGEAIGAVRFCIRIRNQFAHCHWADKEAAGLFFSNLQDPARETDGFTHRWLHVDMPLLFSQLAYFEYTIAQIRWVEHEWLVKTGLKPRNFWPKPPR